MMLAIAYTYHFPPESIGNLDLEDLYFWNEGIGWINEQIKNN